MKFNRRNVVHYLIFLSYFSFFLLTYTFSFFYKKKNRLIYTMGHRLDGNLESFLELSSKLDYEIRYLTFDKDLIRNHDFCYSYINFKNIYSLLNCKLIFATHGILMHKLIKLKKIKTINIGHGVQTSIIDMQNSDLKLFDEVWISSSLDKKIITNDCNYKENNLFITGFLKYYSLLKKELQNIQELQGDFVLYAPTASPKAEKEDIFNAFNIEFLTVLDKLGAKNNLKIIIKPHYNDYFYKNIDLDILAFIKSSKNLIYFEDINLENSTDLIMISELLITDWSSIYLDFLTIDKPIIFLDSFKRRKNITLSRYFENDFIERCKTYSDLEISFEKFKKNEKSFINHKLKKYIFQDFDLESIEANYIQRIINFNV